VSDRGGMGKWSPRIARRAGLLHITSNNIQHHLIGYIHVFSLILLQPVVSGLGDMSCIISCEIVLVAD